jgi:hypothetical protein
MEIDLEFNNENNWILTIAIILVIALILVGLAAVGERMTPVNELGQPRVMNAVDWRIHQATRQYNEEISVLREDIRDVSILLQRSPNPIAAQILYERVAQNTREGQTTTQTARDLTLSAAESVLAWSNGLLDRTEAMSAVNAAIEVLK